MLEPRLDAATLVDRVVNACNLDLTGLPEWVLEKVVLGDEEGVFTPRELIERVAEVLFRDGLLTDNQIIELLLHPDMGIGKVACSLPAGSEFVRETVKRIRFESGRQYFLLDRLSWTESAQVFIREHAPLLRSYNDDFLDYRDGAYHEVEDTALAAAVRGFLNHAKCKMFDPKTKKARVVPFKPNSRDISELINAARHERLVGRDSLSPPCWLDDQHDDMPPQECISLANGVLHAPSGKFIGPTPSFFTRNALAFAYDPAAQCPLWLATLDQYWPPKPDGNPADEVLLLQEIMGYLLLPWTDLQKIFFILGPGRSGKGTIARIIRMLLGELNVAAPSLHSFGGEFGRATLIAKLVAIMSELAFGYKDDRIAITGHLKAISGEDKVEVNRKNTSFWVGTLQVRFLMLANKIPDFADDSTALSARIVALRMNVSFEANPDSQLTHKLAQELPGILNWSLHGYRRLKQTLKFTEPASGKEMKEDLGRLASPTRTFVEERCAVGGDAFITEDELYAAYRNWCAAAATQPDRKGDFVEAVIAGNRGVVNRLRKQISKTDRPRGLSGIRLQRPDEGDAPKIPF